MQLYELYFGVCRYILPVAAILFVVFAAKALLKNRRLAILARLVSPDKTNVIDIYTNETVVGSLPLCDVNINNCDDMQSVIMRSEKGFEIAPISGKTAVFYNALTDIKPLVSGAVVSFNDNEFIFYENKNVKKIPHKTSKSMLAAFVFLLLFQILAFVYISLRFVYKMLATVLITALIFIVTELIYISAKKPSASQSVTLFGFFLTTIGLMAASAGDGSRFLKIAVCAFVGFIAFLLLRYILRYPKLCRKMRIAIAVPFCLLMLYNAFFGTYINGAKNWIYIGDSISFQPSEIVKPVFILCSAALMYELLSKKNFMWFAFLTIFFGFCLAMMRDFGTASIYFVTALIIMSMRVKRRRTIYILLGAALVGLVVLVSAMPYISARFAVYGKVWDYAYEGGYQQTRTMIAIASGGLFGLGGANGNLIYVSAADTDLVFGVVCEEYGLLIGCTVAASYCILLVSSIKSLPYKSSSFYSVSGCAASGLYLFQAALNIFGSVDILPLTGVALPFVSNGGSAMLSSWMLLAFIHAYLETCERGECVE